METLDENASVISASKVGHSGEDVHLDGHMTSTQSG